MRGWVLTAVPVLLLNACMMGPDYTRPETPTADAWRMAPAASASIANLPWWELYKDQELQKLIRAALQENQDLRVAVANVEQFQAQLVIAKFDLAPSLGYAGQGFAYHTQGDTTTIPIGGTPIVVPGQTGATSSTFSNLVGIAGIKWELDVWGRLRRSIEAARGQLLSKMETQRGIVLGLVGNVAEAYFDLRTLDLQVEITKRTLKAWEDSVRLSQIRYKHGDIPKLDLDRFDAERANAAAQLADLERQVVQKENQLSTLLGRKPMGITRGLPLTKQPIPPAVPAGLPSELLQRRPDVLQAEQELVSATATIGVAQAQRFPQFALTGTLGGASGRLDSLKTGPLFLAGGSASVAGPLLNATALGYQVQASEAQAKSVLAQYDKAVVNAFREVEDALIAVQKSREQRDAQEQQVASLQSAFRLANLRYEGGRASYLDVLTAQRSLFDSELALARTQRNQLVSVVQLYKALGGGWSPENAHGTDAKPAAASTTSGGG